MADGVNYAAVLAVEDLSGTKMRVRLPVSAVKDVEREGAGAYPTGLWIGQARMTQVSDVEEELNGLLSYDRKVVKVDVNKIKEANDKLIIE